MKRLFFWLALLAHAALLALPAQAAERYPNRPVRSIVPYPPGGGSDLTARAIGQKLSESFGQTIVIDNRPGATGLIGTELAAKSPPDGHTPILADAPHTINALVYAKRRYNAIKDRVAVLNREVNKALAVPDVKERFASLTLDIELGPPEAFRKLLESEDARWKGVLKQVKIQLD